MIHLLNHLRFEENIKKDYDNTIMVWIDKFDIYDLGTTIEEAKIGMVNKLINLAKDYYDKSVLICKDPGMK